MPLFAGLYVHPRRDLSQVKFCLYPYSQLTGLLKASLGTVLVVLTLLLLSGVHPHSHNQEHDGHEHAHDHSHDHDEESHTERVHICACPCHSVAATSAEMKLPGSDEQITASVSWPSYDTVMIEEPLRDIFQPPKLTA